MRYIKLGFWITLAVLVIAFFHYTLPQRDIVRIVNTYEERQDFGGWNDLFWSAGNMGAGGASANRDVLFIQTVKSNGKTMVYRNEDTGFWPPYFKFDTADLQTEAADAVSPKENPQWYVMTHYGWRSNFLSIFPNATKLRPVEDPNVTLIPWLNIVIILVLLAIFRAIQVRVRRFWRRLRGLEQ